MILDNRQIWVFLCVSCFNMFRIKCIHEFVLVEQCFFLLRPTCTHIYAASFKECLFYYLDLCIKEPLKSHSLALILFTLN